MELGVWSMEWVFGCLGVEERKCCQAPAQEAEGAWAVRAQVLSCRCTAQTESTKTELRLKGKERHKVPTKIWRTLEAGYYPCCYGSKLMPQSHTDYLWAPVQGWCVGAERTWALRQQTPSFVAPLSTRASLHSAPR